MPELRDRLHALDALEVPDVLERARRIGPKTPIDLDPGPSPARRIAVAAFALLLAAVTIVYATRAFRPIPNPPASPTPTPMPSATCAWTPTTLAVPIASRHRVAARLVAGTSRDDLWVIGSRNPWIDQVLRHYDGERWRTVALPDDLRRVYSGDMAAPAPNDLWLLAPNGVARFDGASWSRTTFPGLGELDASTSELLDLEVISSEDAWVAGNVYDASDQTWGPIILHWDGVSWSVSYDASEGTEALDRIVAVSAWAPDDVWAAGTMPGGNRGRPMGLHWDGTTWTALRVPGRRPVPGTEYGVVAVGPNAALMSVNLGVVRWDGAAWVDTGFQAPSSLDVPLEMERGANGAVWAKVWNTAVARWDGTSWDQRPLETFYAYGSTVIDGSAVFAGEIGVGDGAGVRIYDC